MGGSASKDSRRARNSGPSRPWRARIAGRRFGATLCGNARRRGSKRGLRQAARGFSWALACFALMLDPGLAEVEARVAIAILPIVVHSAEAPEYLREGLADMLASRFEQVPQFRVIRVDESSKATTSLSTALQAARDRDADFVLFGSFTRFGQGASLDMQCAATGPTAPGKPLREIFVYAGSIGDVIPDLDELVGKVSRFAIADFEDSAAVSEDSKQGISVSRRLVDDLRKRVEALESSVARLSRRLKSFETESDEE